MSDSLTIKVRKIIAGHFGIDPNRLTDESHFRDDLRAATQCRVPSLAD